MTGSFALPAIARKWRKPWLLRWPTDYNVAALMAMHVLVDQLAEICGTPLRDELGQVSIQKIRDAGRAAVILQSILGNK